ncbi:sialin isoform X2 [Leptopilina heterotoma]|uniref:sialin isoform X2 n=1 Tax=Leptopilina heterotoma TaxID=63436 RepID=UPI001CA86373|nr:sialin isoform X2 [Leptopilina heterotoma]
MGQLCLLSTLLEKIPRRAILGGLMFFACMFSYVIRTNLSIIIVAMVESTSNKTKAASYCASELLQNTTINSTKNILQDFGVRYRWAEKTQGYLLAAYFIGVLPASIPAGILSEKFGGAKVVAFATVVPALLNLLVPVAASADDVMPYFGVSLVFILRFLMGFFGGSVYPALHAMIARWVPPTEKGMFVWTMQGGPFGAFVTFALCGYITSTWGWTSSYYVTSGLMLIFGAIWIYLAYDTPDTHPTITEAEKSYIKEQIGKTVTKNHPKLPVKKLATSVPFLALMWAHFANMWGIYFISTNGPKYTSQIIGLNMKSGGAITGLPYIARLFSGVLFAAAGDFIRRRSIMTVGWIRRIFMIFSHVAPGICLLGMTYAGCDKVLAVVMMILALAFNGAACQTSLQNHQDLSPNYAGSLYGIMNTFGSFPGFILPFIIGLLTDNHNGIEEWRIVFWISAVVFLSATVIFWLFGSAEIQPWNNVGQEGGDDEEEKMAVRKGKEGQSEDEENERL